MTIKLHCFGESGNAYKAALALELSGLDWDPVFVDFFGGETRQEAREVMRWMFWDNHKLSSQAGMTRFLMNFLPEEKRPAEVIGFMQGRLKAAYTALDAHLKGRDWMVGDAITNADLSCCGYLFYPEPFGFDRKDWPEIDRWLSNIEGLPGWKHPYDLMPGSPADRA